MDSFEDWLQSSLETSIPSVVAKWSAKLIELGASWDTFKGDNDATLDDLVDGGIPRLSARDICRSMNEVIQRRARPLIILWDIENVGIPSQTSASLCVTRIKAAVAPHGQIKQFRAYADIALGHIPEQKRSELHLSGCNLVDSTHNGRKEVADKMIIVDSLEFAYTHPDGAALCFITGGVDYAYLLSKLQKPQWTTIVMSAGCSSNTMLHMNCSVKLRWETDVLQLPLSQVLTQGQSDMESKGRFFATDAVDLSGSSKQPLPPPLPNLPVPVAVAALSPLDEALLCSIIKEGAGVGDELPGTRKSWVGQRLKESQPGRFADRNIVKAFLAQAIETGLVSETGEGAFKSLHLSHTMNTKIPLSIVDIPQKVFEVSTTLPYMIFIEKWHTPKGAEAPGTFVQQAGDYYLILMFRTLEEANRTIATELQSKGKLITRGDLLVARQASSITESEEKNIIGLIIEQGDISLSNLKATYKQTFGSDLQCAKSLREYLATSRKIQVRKPNGDSSDLVATCLRPSPGINVAPLSREAVVTRCSGCKLLTPNSEVFFGPDGDKQILCHACFVDSWTTEEQENARSRVVDLIRMMADNDDILAPRNIVRKVLIEKFPTHCSSKGQADFWIDHSIRAGVIFEMKHCDCKKNKLVVLPEYKKFADIPYPVGVDTSEAESFVTNLLWDNGGVMSRKDVSDALRDKFSRMANPMVRGLVMRSGISSGVFFIAKGAYGQTVGLTYEDAKIALEKKETLSPNNFSLINPVNETNKKEVKIYSKEKLLSFKEISAHQAGGRPCDLPDLSIYVQANGGRIVPPPGFGAIGSVGNDGHGKKIFDREKPELELELHVNKSLLGDDTTAQEIEHELVDKGLGGEDTDDKEDEVDIERLILRK